jgi:glutaminyl-tRNA synthetase
LVIDNYPQGKEELCDLPNHPQKPDWGKRQVPFSRELWIEKEDFEQTPPKGYFRLSPGIEVLLRHGYVVKCSGMQDGAVHCTYHDDSKSGTPGADKYKVKGNIHWVSVKHAHAAEIRLYDRLFKVEAPEGIDHLNPGSLKTITAQLEPSLLNEQQIVQFERHGYFVADLKDPKVFNRTVTLRDSWSPKS